VLADLALHVPGEPGAPVVHREQHAGDREPWVELALDQREGVEQAGESLEREVLRLHRHDHPVGGDQGIDGQRPEGRRAVEQRVGEALADRGQRIAQTGLGARIARSSTVAPARSGWAGIRLSPSMAVVTIVSDGVAVPASTS